MLIQQLSVFVENQPGQLAETTAVLHRKGIDIRALSLADTTDFGILRLIVSAPEQAMQALEEVGITVTITNVIAIGVPDEPGGLSQALAKLSSHGVSVEYMYAFIGRTSNTAYVILRPDDTQKALAVLEQCGIQTLSAQEIYATPTGQ